MRVYKLFLERKNKLHYLYSFISSYLIFSKDELKKTNEFYDEQYIIHKDDDDDGDYIT
jgi:hypothetical protein